MIFEGKGYAHGLHSPYWWIKCAVGVNNDDHALVKAYHPLLVWDIMKTPRWSVATRLAEKALHPVIGKSIVLYFRKPDVACARPGGRPGPTVGPRHPEPLTSPRDSQV